MRELWQCKVSTKTFRSAFIPDEHTFKKTQHSPVKMSSPDEKDERHQNERPASPKPSAVSMRSHHSMGAPIVFQGEKESSSRKTPEASAVSMRSHHSMGAPIVFQGEKERDEHGITNPSMVLDADSQDLSQEYPAGHIRGQRTKDKEHQNSNEELHPVWNQRFKSKMQKKFQMINEGIPMQGKSRCLRLKSPQCKLEILWLHDCNITVEGCVALAAALSLKSHLKELDLSSNDLGDQGVKLLSDIKEDGKNTLEKLEV
ncbi:hypothetical protein KOW79_003681 [Hemibagrus wyckioides]|uniref:Uncharacterized protein n=1 Tax=Hemibagrus wyckioides TaxID=337641 RepID=A0A9D3SQI9_9TELE|nr:hypothetical protein KOW79_003681 [Hemibagrus wyckioides]